MITYTKYQSTRKLLTVITSAILGGGYLAGLIALIYVLGSMAEQL